MWHSTVYKLKLYKLSFYIKLIFQKNDNKNLILSFFNTCATDILGKVDCNTSESDEDIEIALASINTMKVVYDCAQISIVDIVTVTFDYFNHSSTVGHTHFYVFPFSRRGEEWAYAIPCPIKKSA